MQATQAKKILLISSGQPSLNPRLVKEADTLSAAGYNVTVLYSYWNDWGTTLDKELIASKKWNAIRVGGHPREKPLTYFFSRLIHKMAKYSFNRLGIKSLADLSIARSSYFLVREAKRHEADLYIGHNLGALPAVVKTAKAHNKPCGFDAEDFHRYELSDDKHSLDVILKAHLEDKYIPKLDYLSTSSPLIANEYSRIYPEKNSLVFLNTFPKMEVARSARSEHTTIKLFWFSQTIGLKRGIEDVINALLLLPDDHFELHLLGNVTEYIRDIFIRQLKCKTSVVHFHGPIPPDQIIAFASQFDIGLALESAFSINNDLALSNKIFSYLQAGMAIVVSDTKSQRQFLYQHPFIGKIYPKGNFRVLADILLSYYNDRDELLRTRKASYELAKDKLNWEIESEKFLSIVKQVLIQN